MDRFWVTRPERRIRRVHDGQMKEELGNIEEGGLGVIERFYEASSNRHSLRRVLIGSGAVPLLGSAHFPYQDHVLIWLAIAIVGNSSHRRGGLSYSSHIYIVERGSYRCAQTRLPFLHFQQAHNRASRNKGSREGG